MEKLEKDWTVYPVLHLDLNTDKYDSKEVLDSRLNLFVSDLEDKYGRNPNKATLSQRFEGIIKRVAEKEGKPVVILVDEYDKPMLQAINDKELQTTYRNTLKAFYGALKSQDKYIRFAFLTGVTKFDMIAKTKDYIYIFEFKYDKTADAALQQIEDKGYAKPLAADSRILFKIGVNFSSEHRNIDDWKVAE